MKEQEIKPFDDSTVFSVENDVLFADGRICVVVMGEKNEARAQRTEFIRTACAAYYPSRLLIEKLRDALGDNNGVLTNAANDDAYEQRDGQVSDNNALIAEANAFLKP